MIKENRLLPIHWTELNNYNNEGRESKIKIINIKKKDEQSNYSVKFSKLLKWFR